jgi:hypothetical protein
MSDQALARADRRASEKTILRAGFGMFVRPGQTKDQIQTISSARPHSTKLFTLTIAALAVTAGATSVQTLASADPGNMTRFGRAVTARYDAIKRDIVDAAEAMPGSKYSFRATPQVRTFAEIIGHIADSQNFFRGVAGGSNPEYVDAIETSRGTKAALVKALKDYGNTSPTCG